MKGSTVVRSGKTEVGWAFENGDLGEGFLEVGGGTIAGCVIDHDDFERDGTGGSEHGFDGVMGEFPGVEGDDDDAAVHDARRNENRILEEGGEESMPNCKRCSILEFMVGYGK